MANAVITASLNQALPDGGFSASTSSTTDGATVAANIATLVADGASPTQAHVTTLNTSWGVFNSIRTSNAAFVYDTGAVTTMNQARALLRAIAQQLAGRLTA
jgi:hypothetical protein